MNGSKNLHTQKKKKNQYNAEGRKSIFSKGGASMGEKGSGRSESENLTGQAETGVDNSQDAAAIAPPSAQTGEMSIGGGARGAQHAPLTVNYERPGTKIT